MTMRSRTTLATAKPANGALDEGSATAPKKMGKKTIKKRGEAPSCRIGIS